MAISEIGTPHMSTGYGNPVNNTHGITIAAGDVVICYASHINERTLSDNNGATPLTRDLRAASFVAGCYYYFFSRTAGASEPSTYSFAFDNEDANWTTMIRVFRGVDPNNHWDDISGTTYARSQVTGTTVAAASITTNYPGSLAIAHYDINGTATTFSSVDNSFAAGLARNAGFLTCATYTKTIADAGAVGVTTATVTPSMSAVNTGGGLVALRPYIPAFSGLTVTRLLQG